jgi:aryl-alcohol dehydrogenase-like predicted oxidoreductase
MNIPTKKLQSGFELPVYGLGLWQMGGRLEADASKDDEEIKAIRAALDAGITHIDTAESYGNRWFRTLCRLIMKQMYLRFSVWRA